VSDRLELAEAVAPGQVLAELRGATLGLMLIEPVCRSYELTLPNKLFEYAQAGLPILTSDLPVIGVLVEREQLGEVADPGDPEQVAAALRALCLPSRHARAVASVRAFAAANRWEDERAILARVYATAVATRMPS
jgi:glycosyltransferase involved in cell wall biosynthesis